MGSLIVSQVHSFWVVCMGFRVGNFELFTSERVDSDNVFSLTAQKGEVKKNSLKENGSTG